MFNVKITTRVIYCFCTIFVLYLTFLMHQVTQFHMYTIFTVIYEKERGTDLNTYIALVLLIPHNMRHIVRLHETVIK